MLREGLADMHRAVRARGDRDRADLDDVEEALAMGAESETAIETKCCGRIERCVEPKKCLLRYVFAGGGKCIYCGWIYDMMPGVEAKPISRDEMLKAHE